MTAAPMSAVMPAPTAFAIVPAAATHFAALDHTITIGIALGEAFVAMLCKLLPGQLAVFTSAEAVHEAQHAIIDGFLKQRIAIGLVKNAVFVAIPAANSLGRAILELLQCDSAVFVRIGTRKTMQHACGAAMPPPPVAAAAPTAPACALFTAQEIAITQHGRQISIRDLAIPGQIHVFKPLGDTRLDLLSRNLAIIVRVEAAQHTLQTVATATFEAAFDATRDARFGFGHIDDTVTVGIPLGEPCPGSGVEVILRHLTMPSPASPAVLMASVLIATVMSAEASAIIVSAFGICNDRRHANRGCNNTGRYPDCFAHGI